MNQLSYEQLRVRKAKTNLTYRYQQDTGHSTHV